jgi:acetylornithine deacetylase
MKGSIACMLAALASVGDEELKHPVYISCSSDEEINHQGAIEISERSQLYRELVDGGASGIVGEPTRLDVVYAHKGGCQIFVTSRGKAAHSSTREGINANMAMIPFLYELTSICDETETSRVWMDEEFDPPTLCVNLGINDHNRALNITAPACVCTICLRTMPTTDVEAIIARIHGLVDQHGLEFVLKASNPPFRRDPDSAFVKQCVKLATGNAPRTVAYGSEAGNFTDIQNLIVIGPGDIAQAHKSDEWVSLEQLASGQHTYADMIRHFCL